MEEVNIYIGSSIHGPRKKAGGYIYILECIRDGQAVTLESMNGWDRPQRTVFALWHCQRPLNALTARASLRYTRDANIS